ncbi:MAG: hypothetical protein RLZZ450_7304 [Pseudomonadota bacterium]
MTGVNLSLGVALIAVQAVNEQLQVMRVRAAIDARWAPEVARLEHARAALDKAVNEALGGAP